MLRRREFLASAVAVTGVSMCGSVSAAFADLVCSPFYPNGLQQCAAGIESDILDVVASDTQHATEWCWAACIQAVFAYFGHDVPQERIVEEAYGAIINMPGSPSAILGSLNRVWKDDDDDRFRVSADTITTNAITAAQDLSQNQPLIIGTLGHAMVLTALQYVRNPYGAGNVTLATVRDPWPYNPRMRALSAQEWYSINFAARIRVQDL